MDDKVNSKLAMLNDENRLKNVDARGSLSNDIINVQKLFKKVEMKCFTIDCNTSSDMLYFQSSLQFFIPKTRNK